MFLGGLTGVAGRVADVGSQQHVAVADIAGDDDARADVRVVEAVEPLRQLLVDVDHQRILLARIGASGLVRMVDASGRRR